MSWWRVHTVAWSAGVPALATAAGCSLVLDFSDSAIPPDAAADAPFSAAECAFGEPNDTAATAVAFAASDVGPAAICPTGGADDQDFYKLTVPAGTASVSIRISFLNAVGDLDLRLSDRSGAMMLSRSSGFGDQETIVCPGASPACSALAPDDYLFEVFPAVAGKGNRYDIAVTITPM